MTITSFPPDQVVNSRRDLQIILTLVESECLQSRCSRSRDQVKKEVIENLGSHLTFIVGFFGSSELDKEVLDVVRVIRDVGGKREFLELGECKIDTSLSVQAVLGVEILEDESETSGMILKESGERLIIREPQRESNVDVHLLLIRVALIPWVIIGGNVGLESCQAQGSQELLAIRQPLESVPRESGK